MSICSLGDIYCKLYLEVYCKLNMNDSQYTILTLLEKGPLAPTQISNRLDISRQALHRNLKDLLKNKLIEKHGSSPHVTYSLLKSDKTSRVQGSVCFFEENFLHKYLKTHSDFHLNHIRSASEPDFAFMLDSAAVYSSNIEGNSLNLNSFLNSRMQPKKLRPKEAQEIEDLAEAYRFSQDHVLNEKNMLKAHAILSKDFVSKARQGVYREEPIGVFSSRGMEYMGVESQYVDGEMLEVFKIATGLLKKKLSPAETFFWASWFHLIIVLVHPFSDGNGRIARLCEKWFLTEKLGSETAFISSEEYYFRNRSEYYEALRLGVNYWEVDFGLSMDFLGLLPKAVV